MNTPRPPPKCMKCMFHRDVELDPEGLQVKDKKGHTDCPYNSVKHARTCFECFMNGNRSKLNRASAAIKKTEGRAYTADNNNDAVLSLRNCILNLKTEDENLQRIIDALILCGEMETTHIQF